MNDGGCVFDSEGARTINRCRQAALDRLWGALDLGLKTVVDAGCGLAISLATRQPWVEGDLCAGYQEANTRRSFWSWISRP
jgi:hypothetical protein